jgi:N-acetylated-alpha-linked acidic dipeptidase
MNLRFEWKNRPLYNVVARIPGTTRPDEWIIFGNHHDAWVSGAADPISGAVSLMETARGLAELLKTGWRPSRTIILALWDGEEWGLLGSTEWAEKHDAELKQKAAVYINTDGTGKGWLNAGGSHGLQQFMGEAAKDVMDPRTGKPVFEEGAPPRRPRRDRRKPQGRGSRSVAAASLHSDPDPTSRRSFNT